MKHETESSGFRPEKLDVRRFAREQASLQGKIKLSDLDRLREEAFGLSGAQMESVVVEWQATGIWRELRGGAAQTRVQLMASLDLPLQCQRCMESVLENLAFDREFLFVADEDTAMKLDDESEEDVLVASKTFDLLELIEDELIMSLPIVPRHENCASQIPHELEADEALFDESDPDAKASAASRPNPFSVLEKIKKH